MRLKKRVNFVAGGKGHVCSGEQMVISVLFLDGCPQQAHGDIHQAVAAPVGASPRYKRNGGMFTGGANQSRIKGSGFFINMNIDIMVRMIQRLHQ